MTLLWLILLMPPGEIITVPPAETRALVEQYVRSRMTGPESLLVEYRSPISSLTVSEPGYTLAIPSDERRFLRGNVSLPVDVMAGDRVVKRIYVALRVRTFETLVITKQRLDRGTVIGPTDVGLGLVETTRLPGEVVRRLSGAIGKRLKSSVEAGGLLQFSVLEEPPQIRQRSLVTLVAQGASFRLTSQAVAMEDGRVGQSIVVRRVGTSSRLKAKVLDASTVQVNIGE